MSSPQTKSSTPRLSEVARHIVVPASVVSTGWPSVRDKCRDLGIIFDEWQHGAGKIILAKRADGKYAATIGGTALSIPRQVGKTFLVGSIVFALCLLKPGLTVIWTAHRLRTADETFDKMQGMARRRRIKPHVAKIVLGSGEEEIKFRNDSRILFGARERGFGRGFDEVDVLIFDEAQILTENAIDDMVPATNQSRQPEGALMLFMGTPPKPTDPGDVFTRMRSEALSGEDKDTGYIEFSANEDFTPTEKPAPMSREDWQQIAKANPSHPRRTPREAILRMRKMLTPESMRREGYGIWDASGPMGPFTAWSACAKVGDPEAVSALGLSMDYDRVWVSLGACADGDMPHVGAVKRLRVNGGLDEMLDETARIAKAYGAPVAIDVKDQASSLIDDLEERGVRVLRASLNDYVTAVSDFYDAVEAKQLSHGDHKDLNDAVTASGWRKVGERRVWAARGGDNSMLKAVTLAKWASGEGGVVLW